MLTKKQYDLLQFIDNHLKSRGVSPSFDEMKDALGFKVKIRNPPAYHGVGRTRIYPPPAPSCPGAGGTPVARKFKAARTSDLGLYTKCHPRRLSTKNRQIKARMVSSKYRFMDELQQVFQSKLFEMTPLRWTYRLQC